MAMSAYEKKQAEKERQKIRDLCIDGLLTNGAMHKQWYLERVLESINVDLTDLRMELVRKGFDWEPGEEP